MPHILEGFKLAERSNMNNHRLILAMIIAICVGIFSTFWSFYHVSYLEGAQDWFADHPFNRLQSWLTIPRPPDIPAIASIFVGLGLTFLLMLMRMNIFWWPLHPAGFAISSSWSMNVFWFSILVSSVLKLIILKHGGMGTHRKVTPFFLGLILGEFIVGGIWSLIGISIDRPMYRFLF